MPQDTPKQPGNKTHDQQISDTERKDGMAKPGEGAEAGNTDRKHNDPGRSELAPPAHRPADD